MKWTVKAIMAVPNGEATFEVSGNLKRVVFRDYSLTEWKIIPIVTVDRVVKKNKRICPETIDILRKSGYIVSFDPRPWRHGEL